MGAGCADGREAECLREQTQEDEGGMGEVARATLPRQEGSGGFEETQEVARGRQESLGKVSAGAGELSQESLGRDSAGAVEMSDSQRVDAALLKLKQQRKKRGRGKVEGDPVVRLESGKWGVFGQRADLELFKRGLSRAELEVYEFVRVPEGGVAHQGLVREEAKEWAEKLARSYQALPSQGKFATAEVVEMVERSIAAAQLLMVLDDTVLEGLFELPTGYTKQIGREEARMLAEMVMETFTRQWVASTLDGWRTTLVRIRRRYKELKGVETPPGDEVDAIFLATLAREVNSQAIEKAGRHGKDVERMWLDQSMGVGLVSTMRRDGRSALECFTSRCKSLRSLGVRLPVDAPMVKMFKSKRRRATQFAAPPVAAVVKLEKEAAEASGNPFVRMVCAGEVKQALSVARVAQAQRTFEAGRVALGLQEGNTVSMGVVRADKAKTLGDSSPYVCMHPVNGLATGEKWMEGLLAGTGVAPPEGIFVDTDSPDGDPLKATRVLQRAMPRKRLLVAKRTVYEKVGGLSKEQAQGIGNNSARRFLHLCSDG